MLTRRICAAALLSFALSRSAMPQAPAALTPLTAEQPDPYTWLENVSSARSIAWVNAENDRSAKILRGDARFATLSADALKVLESPDRLARPDFHNGTIYNTWQDADHVRGIFRRTTLEDYETSTPHWQTVIDFDALGKTDHEKWVSQGMNCMYPGDGLCLVALSAGGEDASTLREFDLKADQFVAGGFVLSKSKQSADWLCMMRHGTPVSATFLRRSQQWSSPSILRGDVDPNDGRRWQLVRVHGADVVVGMRRDGGRRRCCSPDC